MERVAELVPEDVPVAGSDAERRAALAFAARLRAGGRAVTVETDWVRPRWELAHALHAGLGVVASLVAVSAPAVGLGLALVALLSLLLDLGGRAFLLRRLTPERATQNVVAGALAPANVSGAGDGTAGAAGADADDADVSRDAPAIRVILTAHADAPRGGLLRRLALRRAARAGGGRLPGPFAWLALVLAGVAGCAGARLAGAEGSALGAIQLAPTLVLLVALGLLVDAALARPVAGGAGAVVSPRGGAAPGATGAGGVAESGAPAVLLAAVQALDASPPRRLAIEAVLAGAGSGQALGFRAYLRRRRPPPEHNVVIEIAAADAATAPTWWTSDGALLPLRYHPRLVALAAAAAADEPALGARGRRGRSLGAALRARQRRIPAIRLAAPDDADALALALALIELLDEDGAT